MAPDGSRAALSTRGGGSDIWIWELAKPTAIRLTFESENDHGRPVWTPDGRTLLFSWATGTPPNIFRMSANGTGTPERLTNIPTQQAPLAVTQDGKTLLFREVVPKNGADLRVLSLDGDHTSKPLLATRFNEVDGDLSPDGHWLAYQSDDSGRFEIYVRPYPDITSGRWQISNGGGTRPLWGRNGRELFYVSGDNRQMMVTAVQTKPAFSWAVPMMLFDAPYLTISPRSWDVGLDGRFLAIKPVSGETARLNVVENWFEELKARVPTK
jgi:Tol biopolymer transport system component